MTQISKTRVNWPILGKKEWLESPGKDSNLFSHTTYQENTNEEITQPLKKSHNLSRNHATSWDLSQDSNPWCLGLTRIFLLGFGPSSRENTDYWSFIDQAVSDSWIENWDSWFKELKNEQIHFLSMQPYTTRLCEESLMLYKLHACGMRLWKKEIDYLMDFTILCKWMEELAIPNKMDSLTTQPEQNNNN